MPLKNITNEMLDDFQRMDKESALEVYNRLGDEDAYNLNEALKARRQGKLVGTSTTDTTADTTASNILNRQQSTGAPFDPHANDLIPESVTESVKTGLEYGMLANPTTAIPAAMHKLGI